MSNLVYDTLMTLVPFKRRRTASGWISMNGVCCVHNGETPDTRQRMSITIGRDGISCLVACFNCNFRAIWKPGQTLGRKMSMLLGWMGLPDEQLKKLNFKIWQQRELAKLDPDYLPREYQALEFSGVAMPIGAKPINVWLAQDCIDANFIQVVEYLESRGDDILTSYDYWWTPNEEHDLNRRVLIPFHWQGKTVGWTARATFATPNRYHSRVGANYLFNTEVIDNDWEYLFVCEGPFDAIAINGVATLGDKLSDEQIRWLDQCGKKIVVVPDMTNQGGKLTDIAVKNNWYVSIPRWDQGIKDCADAVKRYGKLYTVWTIIDALTNNKLQINVQRQRLK